MRTIIYVDGLNLFHKLLQESPYYWLDIEKMCRQMLPDHHNITEIKHFTTELKKRDKQNPKIALAHNIHLNALDAFTPILEYELGYFRGGREKETDVNIAVQIVADAFLDKYDCAILISNDADLSAALRLVKKHHKDKKIGLFSPVKRNKYVVAKLKEYADFKRTIMNKHLKEAQLPDSIPNSNIKKPFQNW